MSESVELKTRDEIARIRDAGMVVHEVLAALAAAAAPGVTTAELDALAERLSRARGATPSFKGYGGFPASLCASVNEELVHGIPGDRVLRRGDVLKLDFGALLRGYHGDGALTVVVGGAPRAEVGRLLEVTRASLRRAIDAAVPDARLGDVSAAVQGTVEAEGFSVVRELTGHGIGRSLHEPPQVANQGRAGTGLRLRPGLVIAIEPMVNAGAAAVRTLDDGWTVVTADGSLCAHFEHTVAITEDGPVVLTAPPPGAGQRGAGACASP